MTAEETNTLSSILNAGKKEFLAKGFRSASLRSIVKEAGVTTGAFYGYYNSKEDLFRALVDEPAQTFLSVYHHAQDSFAELPPSEQPEHMGKVSGQCMDWMVTYIYEHFDAFKLLICSADGTEYENFIHTLLEVEVKATHQFIAVLKSLGYHVKKIDSQLEHMLISGMFSGFFEIVVHDMPQEQAAEYIKELREFYTAGWTKIMGLS